MQKDDITKLVDIEGFSVAKIDFSKEGKVPEVKIHLKRDKAVFCCSGCGQFLFNYYDSRREEERDLPYGKWKKASFVVDKVRVECENCGVKVEQLDWIDVWARLTKRFEEEVARECRLIQSIRDVAWRFHLGWDTVKEIDKKYLDKELNPPDFSGLRYLAVDEISTRKGHNYATVIADADRSRVMWVVKDRKKESLGEFYKKLGPEGCEKIKAVAMDMHRPYEEATKDYCPKAKIVYDEFHVVQGYGKVIDEVRNLEVKKATEKDQKILKGTKYLLLSNKENIRREDHAKLRDLLSLNRRISTVYVLKDDLKHLWDYKYKGAAERWFEGWYKRAIYSRIEPLKKFARSLKAHLKGILTHCRDKLGTSFLEGMNNKIKVIKRIAFGFRDMDYFFLKIRGAFGGT